MSDDKQVIHDLLGGAITNRCYLSWAAAGLIGGSLVKPGLGTAIGFAGGLLWASFTCKPIAENVVERHRFISEADFKSFHDKINSYYPVSREEAFALAQLVQSSPSVEVRASSPNIRAELEQLFSMARGSPLWSRHG